MTNRGDLLAPPRTSRPRHKAAPWRPPLSVRRPGLCLRGPSLTAALQKVTPARLDRVSIPPGTGGVASGLAVASIGALVTIMIANSGHHAVQPHPAPSVTRVAAELPSLHMPRPVYHPRTVARRKRHRAAPPPPPQMARAQRAPTASPLSGITNGINWRAAEARSGLPRWAQRMMAAWGQALAGRDQTQGTPSGTAPAQGPPTEQVPAQGSPDGQAPAWP